MEPRRQWVPDIDRMADELVEDFRAETDDSGRGSQDAISTLASWEKNAKTVGGEITEDDLHALILRLARMAAGITGPEG